ncbi:translocation and assembly module lipoprotein TamL [Flavobacterium orientale]|uniref:Membrane protein n=1 Tax=Flavobacterium orientale TaxID=1756020 RepID=A0A916XY31_9FLAO|nr:BamA/TamA family outer membrane protein [Flavobacterium orientale]GGD20175.1 membrane protein [Flavobacterium orientale]
MKSSDTKIVLLIVITILIYSCNTVKRVPDGKSLLVNTEIIVDGKASNQESVNEILIQKPNSRILKIPLSLLVYNLAQPNPDSVFKARFIEDSVRFKRIKRLISEKQVYRLGESFFYQGFNNFLKSSGEAPEIVDDEKTKKSTQRLYNYYFNNGYFDVETSSKTDSVGFKRAKTTYEVSLGKPYIIDSIKTAISSPDVDSLYQVAKSNSAIKSGEQFKSENFSEERNRLTSFFRNRGVYQFQQNYINFDIDTIGTGKKPNITIEITDFNYRKGDTIVTVPFEIFTISEVNIFTDSPSSKNKIKVADSISYKGFNLYSTDKIKYKPKAITDAVFITKGNVYADYQNTLTNRYLSNLKVFNYPTIQYIEDERDTISNSLIANIYLNPRKKYSFLAAVDFTHSNIQDFGISGNTSLTIRNVFNGAETFEFAVKGTVGSSRDLAGSNDNFFNISEVGVDAKLNFPRIFFPFNTDKIIPKSMIPSTNFGVGFAKQKNIGLDKENFTSSLTYNWNPKRFNTVRFDLFNIQYVKNLRIDRYFDVYRSSYNALNTIAEVYSNQVNPDYFDPNNNLIIESGTNGFLNDVLGPDPSIVTTNEDFRSVRGIDERKKRLTENNLIVASSYSYTKSTKTSLLLNNFYILKAKVESAGNLLSLLSRTINEPLISEGSSTFFDVEYSQYIKTEFEFIKHWDLKRNRVFATRTFAGVAIPYGNSNNIPFSRSYFAGGTNDNRAWRPYSLGPGSSGALNDFNEANLKLALNAEYRFKLFGNFRGAFFADLGNIWNFLDNVTLEGAKFTGIASLKDIALGTGIGTRYDFSFFVVRFDLGFKTYNPANEENRRWMKDFNFKSSVLNIGINYPF